MPKDTDSRTTTEARKTMAQKEFFLDLLKSPAFTWTDSNEIEHDMIEMSLSYLKNALKTLNHTFPNSERKEIDNKYQKLKSEKKAELETAIKFLEMKSKTFPQNIKNDLTLRSFEVTKMDLFNFNS